MPSGGIVTSPPITAPSPSVENSRNLLRGNRSPGAGSGMPAAPTFVATAGAAGGGGGSASLLPFDRSRTQRKPNRSTIAPPTATAGQLTISPTRTQTMPIANPIGHSVGDGRCALSSPGLGSTS